MNMPDIKSLSREQKESLILDFMHEKLAPFIEDFLAKSFPEEFADESLRESLVNLCLMCTAQLGLNTPEVRCILGNRDSLRIYYCGVINSYLMMKERGVNEKNRKKLLLIF